MATATTRPVGPSGSALVALVARLVRGGPVPVAIEADHLGARLGLRLEQARKRMIEQRLGNESPVLRTSLEMDHGGRQAALDEAADRIDARLALALLDEPAGRTTAIALLDHPDVAVREAALDVVATDAAGNPAGRQLARLCDRAARSQLDAAIGRLPLSPEEGRRLRDLLHPEPAGAGTAAEAGDGAFLSALRSGHHAASIRLLAEAARVPVGLVNAAIASRNRRGLLSLAWKAGFSAQAAVLLQSQLAGIAPDTVLLGAATGGSPLDRSEMVWQIALLESGGLP